MVLGTAVWCYSGLQAQEWATKMQDRAENVHQTIQDFDQYWGNQPYKRGYGWKQFKRWQDFWEPRVFPHGFRPPLQMVWDEHNAFKRNYPTNNASSRNANWTSLGPDNWATYSYNPGLGRVNVVAEDPNNSNVLYVGTPAGGCWKSADAGATWTVLTDDFQSLGVSAIAIDPSNSNTVYIGTGDDDGSDTYSVGMFKSSDAGATWTEVTIGSSSIFGNTIYKILMHPSQNNTLFIISSNGCHKSTDGGATWTLLLAGVWKDMELKPGDPNTMYLSNTTFYKTTDGGNSWNIVNTGLPNYFSINRSEIAVSPANPDYVYFLCGKNTNASFFGLYRSDNSGQSFNLQANSPNIFAYDMTGSDTDAGQSWYDMALTVSPLNAEEIYVGGINVWKSTDGGLSFTIKTHWVYPPSVAYVHADIHTLEYLGNRLYCGSDGGIFVSTNGGNNFTDLSSGLNITQFYSIGGSEQVPNKIIGGTQDNGTNIMENGTATHIRGADGMVCIISPNDSLVLYTSSQYGNFRRSDDGGFNFQSIFPTEGGNGAWVTPLAINPQDNDMLLVGYSELYFSLDKGLSDTKISNFNAGLLRHVAIAPSAGYTHFYAATYNSIYATYDSGQNWTDIKSGLPSAAISSITVHPTDPMHLWVTFSGFQDGQKIFESFDGGNSWSNISANLPNIPVNCLAYQTGGGFYVGTDLGVYYKNNILAGWQQYMNGLPNVIVRDLEINYTAGKIRAGTYGRGLWESALSPPITTVPTANFSYDSNQACSSDSIQFNDVSVDNAPGWTWYFPGGAPASSTLSNPKVLYPASGIYSVTLIVENPIGYDTISKSVAIEFNPNEINLDIQLDNAAVEVFWNLKDQDGATLLNSPIFAYSNLDSQRVSYKVCVDSGCLMLEMLDVGSNGLCCANGGGFYLVRDGNGDTLAFGNNYTNVDSAFFCVNQSILLDASFNTVAANCGNADGNIEVVAIGGGGQYQYSIDNGNSFQQSPNFSVAGGNYTLIVVDGLGQQISRAVTVPQVNQPVAVASANSSSIFLNQGGIINLFSTNSIAASTIVWTFPDATNSSLDNPNYTFTAGGQQMIILTVTNGNCTDSDTLLVDVIDNVNIERIAEAASIQIIPNPVSDKFELNLSFEQLQQRVEVVIHNSLGQQVFWQALEDVQSYKRSIHFGNQAAGLYWISIKNEAFIRTKQFIKQ